MVTLPEGKHTLQLVLGDWTHIPLVPPVMSEPIASRCARRQPDLLQPALRP